jgi:anti-sigma regulatory factor (Ser/Thr protein kinase)
MSANLRLDVGKDLKDLSLVTARLRDFGRRYQIQSALMGKVNLCLEELLVNIIRHGIEDEAGVGPIYVDLELIPEALRVELLDSGRAFDPFTEAPSPDLESGLEDRPIGGLGVHLVKALANRYEYRRELAQNRVTLWFSID